MVKEAVAAMVATAVIAASDRIVAEEDAEFAIKFRGDLLRYYSRARGNLKSEGECVW